MSRLNTLLLGGALAVMAVNPVAMAGSEADTEAAIQAVLQGPDRLPGDSNADARRKPAQVLAFFGIRPGMTVLEMRIHCLTGTTPAPRNEPLFGSIGK